MKYFELFSIPESFVVDQSQLARKYFELQKQSHPDFFAGSSLEEQEQMMLRSSEINQAFRIFKDQDNTIRYVLEQQGALVPEEKYALSSSFLMEVMEINEMKMEDADPAEVKAKAQQLMDEILLEVKPLLAMPLEAEGKQERLAKIKEYYYRKKYLDRIMQTD